MSTEISHTLPTGETIDFTARIEPSRGLADVDGQVRVVVTYPLGVDLSGWSASEAYPTAAIEAWVSSALGAEARFCECVDFGADSSSYEVWVMAVGEAD